MFRTGIFSAHARTGQPRRFGLDILCDSASWRDALPLTCSSENHIVRTEFMTTGFLAASLLLLTPAAFAQNVAGMWDATINFNGAEIPFKMELSDNGANVKGWFFNGDDREISNSGNLTNGSLTL